MKNFTFSSILILVLFLTGCGGNDDAPKPVNKATFRVELTQEGDYLKFNRIITISGDGSGFKYTGTNNSVPAVLMEDDLKPASISMEGKDLGKLKIMIMTEFSALETGPARVTLHFRVFKNNKLVEDVYFNYSETVKGKSELLEYDYNTKTL
ncbi:beta-barrel fold lipoprotein [Adhaeribacter radiodurans]|uniref:Lipoprotein n=1 Tax=Adhaeribacter radiodurans TaxID=2745197 RepID=A0A7L7LBJ8_9BACT|nr:hypothetical protein [Adhaeribacter radiodurans]QMU29769.1 hypothetical protein HUW48_17845 [Adhaeribacter radiodurans]